MVYDLISSLLMIPTATDKYVEWMGYTPSYPSLNSLQQVRSTPKDRHPNSRPPEHIQIDTM